jgi:hypothetical protein
MQHNRRIHGRFAGRTTFSISFFAIAHMGTSMIRKVQPIRFFKTHLITERGWTVEMIDKLLGEPDAIRGNPKSRNPFQLYNQDRVLAVENSPAFIAAKEEATPRSIAARKGIQTRKDALMKRIEAMEISVEEYPLEDVKDAAIRNYNTRQLSKGSTSFFSRDSDPDELERITVNFIRHELTTYDRDRELAAKQPGAEDARFAIRKKIFDAIAEVYLDLAHECDRQLYGEDLPWIFIAINLLYRDLPNRIVTT